MLQPPEHIGEELAAWDGLRSVPLDALANGQSVGGGAAASLNAGGSFFGNGAGGGSADAVGAVRGVSSADAPTHTTKHATPRQGA